MYKKNTFISTTFFRHTMVKIICNKTEINNASNVDSFVQQHNFLSLLRGSHIQQNMYVCALLSFIYTGKQNVVIIINSEVFLDILTTTKMWKAYKSPIIVKVWKNLVTMSSVIVGQSGCKFTFLLFRVLSFGSIIWILGVTCKLSTKCGGKSQFFQFLSFKGGIAMYHRFEQ